MSSAHSPTFPSLLLRHRSFSNPSVTLPTSQLILQLFRCFTYVTAHSPTLQSPYLRHSSFSNFPSLHLRHSSFSNHSVTFPTSQLILQHFHHFTYVTAHSPTLPSRYLRHSSFSNLSITSPTSQLILQPFRCVTYVKAHSPTVPLLHLWVIPCKILEFGNKDLRFFLIL